MTEQKRDYMLEALGEIEDTYIEEAVTYRKEKSFFRYRKEFGALAACFAVVLLATFAYRYMPIRSGDEVDESYAYGVSNEMLNENDATTTANEESMEVTSNKEQTEVTNDANKDYAEEICGYPTIKTESSVEHSLVWMEPEEIIAQDTDIFMGTVTQKEVRQVANGATLHTILTVEVENSIKGDTEVGEKYTIFLPVGQNGEVVWDTSISGDLLKLDVGSRAIFIPRKASSFLDASTGEVASGTLAALLSNVDYYISEGIRYLILETEDGLSFEQNVYQIEGGTSATLEEAAKYFETLLIEVE